MGADRLTGGGGDDTYVVDNAGDRCVESAGGGTDRVQAAVSYTLAANLEYLTLTGAAPSDGTGNTLANTLTGNGAANRLDGGGGHDLLLGNAGDDSLIGGTGNDTLDGGSGGDELIGGSGNDSYRVDSVGDLVTELSAQGTDTVESRIGYTLPDQVECLTLTGSAPLTAPATSWPTS